MDVVSKLGIQIDSQRSANYVESLDALADQEREVSLMRYLAYLFVALVLWGLADDFLVGRPQVSPRAFASDDDEYLLGKVQRTRQELTEQEKSALAASVPFLDAHSTFAEARLPFSSVDLRPSGCDSCLYVFMSLQI
jgi:hypothetical protein